MGGFFVQGMRRWSGIDFPSNLGGFQVNKILILTREFNLELENKVH